MRQGTWRLAALAVVAHALAPASTAPFHVHVGAGKLGLSLVVPAVASAGARFAVIDTPADPSWKDVLAARAGGDERPLKCFVNGEEMCALHVAGPPKAKRFPALVITDDEATLGALITEADTLSCSLGPFMEPVLTRLLGLRGAGRPKPTLYCCENDHDAVARLKASVGDAATVVDCMVDRISSTRTVDAAGATVRIEAEAWKGTIVPLDPAVNRARPPPFGSGNGADVLAPATDAEASYLSDRKLALVNGMHTTLAFLTLRDSKALWPGELGLLKPGDADAAERGEIWRWALARICVLLHDHGVDRIRAVHGLDSDAEAFDELRAYAKAALDRFDSADDTVARVLGGGVAKRWQGRLAVAESGLARALADDDGPVAAFLKREGVTGAEIQKTLAVLVDATQETCQVDYDALDGQPDDAACAPEREANFAAE